MTLVRVVDAIHEKGQIGLTLSHLIARHESLNRGYNTPDLKEEVNETTGMHGQCLAIRMKAE